MAAKLHIPLEDLDIYCRAHGMHVELDTDDRAIGDRNHRQIVRVTVVREPGQMRLGRPRVAGSRPCTLATLDHACRELLAAL